MTARRLLPIGICLLIMGAGTLRAQAPAMPENAVVLLRNGHLLRGTVANEGEQILVRLAPGSEVRLPRGQVQIVARSLEELVAVQRRQLHADDVSGRLQLARWCHRNELPTQAGELLVELVRLAPTRQDVLALERQLRQSAGRAGAPSTVEVAGQTPSDESSPATASAELDSIVKEVSPAAFDNYMKHIQPLLLNHCAASGCHGVASRTDFQLLRPLSGTRLSQRMTQRNLQSTLKQIDRADPLSSSLLSSATTAHGGMAEPILAGPAHQRNVESLRQWLESINAAEAPGDALDQPATRSPTSVNAAADKGREGSTRPAIFAQMPPSQSTPRGSEPPDVPEDVRRGAQPKDAPRDPFDPEAFNRRFFPERFQQQP
jgi:hypothetical protein